MPGVVIGAVLLLLAGVLKMALDPAGSGANGTGLTYSGEFYALSGAEVRPERLGDVLAEDVAFQDTTTDVRLITGVSADRAVAVWIRVPDDETDQGRSAWLLLSPDPDLAADPWSDGELTPAVRPEP